METPILEELKKTIVNKLKDMANFCDYLIDFYPEEYLKGGEQYYETRDELVNLEKKQYFNYEFCDSKFIVYLKSFVVLDDTIDEVDSSWVEEKILLTTEFNINELTPDEIINELIDNIKENEL